MSEEFTAEQIAQFKEIFNLYGDDGRITTNEIGTVLRALGKKATEAELQDMINEVGSDGNDTLDFTRFLNLMTARNMKLSDFERGFKDAFEHDDQPEGKILCRELLQPMIILEEAGMLKEGDVDGGGLVNEDEFMKRLDKAFNEGKSADE
ncbi:unnamed protein product [Eruca vesicaria subsp. sativa]|uniref:EF-hand domain-containing protein n=1 Tax=Eruca vesicaria subsp. sativa TaxID=29727 RepID=A0ABC8ISU8_ERUVS|nr:unnamed protein product [Eruca vesicaria subsp. sativa]